MPVINISVENKIAEADGTLYVCGNSDFVAKFAFDAEWEAYENKTARFCYNNSYVDVVFTGNECPVPIISGTYFFNIGVYAGNLHTTTPARVPCKKSILCDTGFPADPPNDVYNQIMAKLNSLESADPEAIAKAVANYLAEHPVKETDPTVPEWAKAEITGATVGQIAKITAVDETGKPTKWEPVDIPSGGGGDKPVVKIIDTEITEKTAKFEVNNLQGVRAIVAIWGGISNETETDSGLDLKINDVQISSFKFIPNRKKGYEVYGYSIAALVNDFWVCTVSAGAISGSNNSPASVNLSTYNLIPGVGAANKIAFNASTEGYAPVAGKLEVWAR
nr:MAG TPA: hypothetical protein [Caudoviricetes sp.]